MGFFKSILNDIKLSNTPVGNYKNKIVDYFNFVSVETSNKKTLSQETAEFKSVALAQELLELSETLDPNGNFTMYLPIGELNLNVDTSREFISELHGVLLSKQHLNMNILLEIIKSINIS